jgi:hypothetical protein
MDRGILVGGHLLNIKDVERGKVYGSPGVGIPQCKTPSADRHISQ